MENASFRSLLFVSLLLAVACGPAVNGDDGGTGSANEEPVSCSLLGTCEGGLTCCDGSCIDTDNDPDHCGACNMDCSDEGGFCSSDNSCAALTWNAICENTNLLALRDGNAGDDATTNTLRDEIAALCGLSPQNGGSNDDSLVASDGRPLVGTGTTIVMGGGGFFQPPIHYAESGGATPVFTDQIDNGNTSRLVRRDGQVLATVPSDTTGAGGDWFTVYLAEAPVSGALLLAAYGFTMNGTEAAGVWAPDAIFNDLSAADTWYVVRWDDSDAMSGPSPGDDFSIVDSGS